EEDSDSPEQDKKQESNKEKGEEKESSDEANAEDNTGKDIPEEVEIINMPRLSDTMEEGTVAQWLKKEGDKVEEGDILAEIETDKATMEFESFYAGTLLKIGVQEGESAPVDSVLAIIGPKGTDVSGVVENFKKGGKSSDKKEKTSEEKPSKENKKDEKDEKDIRETSSEKEPTKA